jgi:hypothetical protein
MCDFISPNVVALDALRILAFLHTGIAVALFVPLLVALLCGVFDLCSGRSGRKQRYDGLQRQPDAQS